MDTLELRKNLWEEVLGYHQQNNFACLNYWSTLVKDRKNVRCLYIYIFSLLSYFYYHIGIILLLTPEFQNGKQKIE